MIDVIAKIVLFMALLTVVLYLAGCQQSPMAQCASQGYEVGTTAHYVCREAYE